MLQLKLSNVSFAARNLKQNQFNFYFQVMKMFYFIFLVVVNDNDPGVSHASVEYLWFSSVICTQTHPFQTLRKSQSDPPVFPGLLPTAEALLRDVPAVRQACQRRLWGSEWVASTSLNYF